MLPDPRALEHAALSTVPAPRVAFDGPFVVRAFAGGTGRANAASSIDPAPDPALEDRIARIEALYAALGLPPRFRSTPLDPPGLAEALAARGYVTKDETVILLAPIVAIAAPEPAATAFPAPDADWMAVTATAEHQTPARRREKEGTPALLMVPGAWVTLHEDGAAAAVISVVAAGRLGMGAVSAHAAGAVQSTLTSFARANPGVSALVWRLDQGGPVAVARITPDTPRIPASNMKMITAAGALLQMGPDFRFTTRVATSASARLSGGTLTGPLYLIGAGDPLLATRAYAANFLPGARSTPMVDLVKPLKRAGIRKVRGDVIADESLFDARRMGPTWPSYYSSYAQPLSALASNQNYADDRRGSYASQPWRTSARRLVSSLKGVGVSHTGRIRHGSTPAATRVLAATTI